MKGTEPSDAIRVVNALLTQIDQIKKYEIRIDWKDHNRRLLFIFLLSASMIKSDQIMVAYKLIQMT